MERMAARLCCPTRGDEPSPLESVEHPFGSVKRPGWAAGFLRVRPNEMGRPGYDPASAETYIYDLNRGQVGGWRRRRIATSRRSGCFGG